MSGHYICDRCGYDGECAYWCPTRPSNSPPAQTHTSAMQKAREVAENCIPIGLSGNHYRSTLVQHIAATLISETAAKDAEIERLNRCLNLANERTDENFTKAVFNAKALAEHKALLKEAVEMLRPFARKPDASSLAGVYGHLTRQDAQAARAFLDKIGDR